MCLIVSSGSAKSTKCFAPMHLHSDLQNSSCWESWVDPEPTANERKQRDNLCAQIFTKWLKLSCLLTTHLWIVASQFSVDSFSITMSSVPHNPNNNLCAKSTHLYLLSTNEAKEELSQRLTSEKILTEIILSFDFSWLFFFLSLLLLQYFWITVLLPI